MESVEYCKLEIFIPETHLKVLQETLQVVDAGHIGQYDSCMAYSPVIGCWRPLEGSAPYLGRIGEISAEPELKVEVICLRARVDETVEAVKRIQTGTMMFGKVAKKREEEFIFLSESSLCIGGAYDTMNVV